MQSTLVGGARVALSQQSPYAARTGVVSFINTATTPAMVTVKLEHAGDNDRGDHDADAMVVVPATHVTIICHEPHVVPLTPQTAFRPVRNKRDRGSRDDLDEDELDDDELRRIHQRRFSCPPPSDGEEEFALSSSSAEEQCAMGAGASALMNMQMAAAFNNTPAAVRSLGVPGVGSPPSLDGNAHIDVDDDDDDDDDELVATSGHGGSENGSRSD